jgi:signal transduction histidine kinase
MIVKTHLLGFGAPVCARRFFALAVMVTVLATSALVASMGSGAAKEQLSRYAYSDTKNLISLVEDAAALMERDGDKAFAQFGQPNSRWFNQDNYLFVYALDGTCLFHPVTPELVGTNVMPLRDINGKPIIRLITDVGHKPANDASGWVFYLWENQTQLTPSWKSTYVRKVVRPDGQTYVVGGGSYTIKVERPFVEERVRLGADLLQSAGKSEAFRQFQDPASPFVFLDSFIFVLNDKGRTIVDPAFPTMAGRDMSQFQDAVGLYPIREVLKKLTQADEAWIQYLWPKPGAATTSRKLIYARKVVIDSETLVVGSDFFLATPIWMKVEDSRSWPRNPPA